MMMMSMINVAMTTQIILAVGQVFMDAAGRMKRDVYFNAFLSRSFENIKFADY